MSPAALHGRRARASRAASIESEGHRANRQVPLNARPLAHTSVPRDLEPRSQDSSGLAGSPRKCMHPMSPCASLCPIHTTTTACPASHRRVVSTLMRAVERKGKVLLRHSWTVRCAPPHATGAHQTRPPPLTHAVVQVTSHGRLPRGMGFVPHALCAGTAAASAAYAPRLTCVAHVSLTCRLRVAYVSVTPCIVTPSARWKRSSSPRSESSYSSL